MPGAVNPLKEEIEQELLHLERSTGRKFGGFYFSVRSGAAVSMRG